MALHMGWLQWSLRRVTSSNLLTVQVWLWSCLSVDVVAGIEIKPSQCFASRLTISMVVRLRCCLLADVSSEQQEFVF